MHLSSTTCLHILCGKDENMAILSNRRYFRSLLCICSKPAHKRGKYNTTVMASRQTHQTQTILRKFNV